ncbi:sensor histidine kinase [Marinicrinis lubricantis]|uniref:histidine kinase n=1 Tax=Marinicrinis lubricantis TaxID=2086470 RepID=A0ABW1IP91_9BACL
MQRIGSRWFAKLQKMRILPKLVIGYIVLICIPFSLFGYLFYQETYSNMLDQYRTGKEQLMEQSYNNFQIELSKIESIQPLFQNNTKLTEYLGGLYQTDWEAVYNYRKEISPSFSFAYISNPFIRNITIYKNNSGLLELSSDIVDMALFDDDQHYEAIQALPANQGLWTYQLSGTDGYPELAYTHKLYTDQYIREVGLLRITLNENPFSQFYQTLQSDGEISRVLLDGNLKPLYKVVGADWDEALMEEVISKIPKQGMSSFYIDDDRYLVNSVHVKQIDMTIVEISKVEGIFNLRGKEGWFIVTGVLLLGVLSVIYYMVASSITLRILRFTRHMKRTDDPKLAIYTGKSGSDEIGYLISSYNAMITRIHELMNKVNQTELMKKEADLKMLQAQIKPHFLYNTLETMRMLALMKDDEEVADIAVTLADLLRYSLSKSKDITSLKEELNNVRQYISIHQIRMGDRLKVHFDIEADTADFHCPRFILQPIVENSILHGIGKKRGSGEIRVEVRQTADKMHVVISDNGAGIPEERLKTIREVLSGEAQPFEISSGGIGIYNVNERIKAFFNNQSQMTVESTEGEGTQFHLVMTKKGDDEDAEIDDRG